MLAPHSGSTMFACVHGEPSQRPPKAVNAALPWVDELSHERASMGEGPAHLGSRLDEFPFTGKRGGVGALRLKDEIHVYAEICDAESVFAERRDFAERNDEVLVWKGAVGDREGIVDAGHERRRVRAFALRG